MSSVVRYVEAGVTHETLEDVILNRGGRSPARFVAHCSLPREQPLSEMLRTPVPRPGKHPLESKRR